MDKSKQIHSHATTHFSYTALFKVCNFSTNFKVSKSQLQGTRMDKRLLNHLVVFPSLPPPHITSVGEHQSLQLSP